MPGRLFMSRTTPQISDFLGALESDMVSVARQNISPGQKIVVCDQYRRLSEMRWGIIPVGRVNARGRPVMQTIVNVRSETVFEKSAFDGMGRCLVPADGWYEWTGKGRKKTAWRISRADGQMMAFAAVCDFWTAPNGIPLPQVATVTCAPSADVRDIHDRMGVIVQPADFANWLDGSPEQAAKLMQPLEAGALHVEQARGVDWSAA